MADQTATTEPTSKKPTGKAKQAAKNWFRRHKILTGILAIVLLIILVKAFGGASNSPASSSAADTASTATDQSASAGDTSSSSGASAPAPAAPAGRTVTGTATTLGAGNFSVGTDVAPGLYDVTAPAGQSGNFVVNGSDGSLAYNEVIGDPSQGDVAKIRVNLTKGDQVQISSMSGVKFTPVTAPFVTAHATTSLYAGHFVVGQDIGAGKYVATPASGESGNFDVYDSSGSNKANEILGSDTASGDVPSYTLTLNDGDVISLSGIDSVTFTAQ